VEEEEDMKTMNIPAIAGSPRCGVTIYDVAGDSTFSFDIDRIDIGIYDEDSGDEIQAAAVSRSTLLDAVRQLGVIMIERAELPKVIVRDDGRLEAGAEENNDPYSARADGNPNWAWHYALNVLAVYEHMKAYPPVDPADIEALAAQIRDHRGYEKGAAALAEALLATGRVQVTR